MRLSTQVQEKLEKIGFANRGSGKKTPSIRIL
jgi:hypothetical protein